jgi:non-ribosomal peptide synthetase component E (peptide arylation enzyme)
MSGAGNKSVPQGPVLLLRNHPAGIDPVLILVGGRNIVLFTNEVISLTDANACLTQDGFRGVMRLDAIQQLDKIPLLGTGKIDYRRLKALVKENIETKT